jgi:DNA-binding NtrC family response regulator
LRSHGSKPSTALTNRIPQKKANPAQPPNPLVNPSGAANNHPMIRPCYLVVDRETSSAISTRKLILETAKFNVITAYSSTEAIATLEKFPNIDGVVADAGIEDMPCEQLVIALKQLKPTITVIVICTPRYASCTNADHSLESFSPKVLLALLEKLHPQATAEIEKRNEELEKSSR